MPAPHTHIPKWTLPLNLRRHDPVFLLRHSDRRRLPWWNLTHQTDSRKTFRSYFRLSLLQPRQNHVELTALCKITLPIAVMEYQNRRDNGAAQCHYIPLIYLSLLLRRISKCFDTSYDDPITGDWNCEITKCLRAAPSTPVPSTTIKNRIQSDIS